MNVINYCSGGLGNRLMPLASCDLLAKSLGRNFLIYWKPAPRCMARFEAVYKNTYLTADLLNLDLNETCVYANYFDVVNDSQINNVNELLTIVNKIGCIPVSHINQNNIPAKNNIIIYHNTVLPGYEDVSSYLKSLEPTDDISNYVSNFVKANDINKSVYGIHARSTDFVNSSFDNYQKVVDKITIDDKLCKIYFCSDSPEWEQHIKKLYPNNIIIRQKEDIVKKMSLNDSWINNAYTSEAAVIEGLKDILILSKTNFVYYDANSTFAILVKKIQS